MHPTQIIKEPIITEKCTWQATHEIAKGKRAGQPMNRYSFHVDMRARKPQIKRAVESIYKVRVVRVSTQVRKGSYFRTRFGVGKTSNWKRATVQLHPDDRIDLF